jgi:hypothetical protein
LETELAELVKGRKFKYESTTVALLMELHLDGDPWALGDSLIRDVGGEDAVSAASERSHQNTGLYATLEDIRHEMQEAGALTVSKKFSTVRKAHATARAWPEEYRRSEIATWSVHASLTSSTQSAEQRAKLIERLARRAKRPRVTVDDLRLYRESQRRAEGKIPKPLSFQELLEQRLRRALRSWASPQTIDALKSADRDGAIRTLRTLASEIERGEFA